MDTDHDHFRDRCSLGDKCPLVSVHARLSEAHRHWHHAADAYAEPDSFRTYLNACVQALRNVTFVLQNQKSVIPAFDEWYAEWQAYLKTDTILNWVVKARNRIVKQDDLETRSIARVALVSSYEDPPYLEFEVKPSTPTQLIIEVLVATKPESFPDDLLDSGFLKVERRWVVEELPDPELLEALAHAFAVLQSLVRDAHLQLTLGDQRADRTCTPSEMVGRPPGCMIATQELRTACVNARTGQLLQLLQRPSVPIPSDVVQARYGLPDLSSLRKRTGSSLRDMAEYLFGFGKQILERDGFHHPIVFLISDKEIHTRSLEFEDQMEKYLIWRSVAADVERLGVNRVIGISESWFAPFDSDHPERRAVDSPDRSEALDLCAASEDGERYSITCLFERIEGKIVFGETITDETDGINIFVPIYHVWRKRT